MKKLLFGDRVNPNCQLLQKDAMSIKRKHVGFLIIVFIIMLTFFMLVITSFLKLSYEDLRI